MNLPSRFFVWNESFELGIPSIDADHQGFLELMNNLCSAMDRGEGRNRTQATLDALRAYATYHFIREEDVMGAAGYPGLHAQQVEHAWYLYYLEKLDGLSDADPARARETMEFMRTWFVDHILGTDKRFSQWLTATEGDEAVARHLEAEATSAGLRRSA
jgi:hemerythrin